MWNLYAVVHLVLFSITFSLIDLRFHKIFKNHVIVALLFAAPFVTLGAMVSGVLNYCFYNLLHRASRGALGFGDVRLAFLIGVYAHHFTKELSSLISANLYSWLCAGVVAVALFMWSRRNLEERLAFAPFMFLGLLITLVTNH